MSSKRLSLYSEESSSEDTTDETESDDSGNESDTESDESGNSDDESDTEGTGSDSENECKRPDSTQNKQNTAKEEGERATLHVSRSFFTEEERRLLRTHIKAFKQGSRQDRERLVKRIIGELKELGNAHRQADIRKRVENYMASKNRTLERLLPWKKPRMKTIVLHEHDSEIHKIIFKKHKLVPGDLAFLGKHAVVTKEFMKNLPESRKEELRKIQMEWKVSGPPPDVRRKSAEKHLDNFILRFSQKLHWETGARIVVLAGYRGMDSRLRYGAYDYNALVGSGKPGFQKFFPGYSKSEMLQKFQDYVCENLTDDENDQDDRKPLESRPIRKKRLLPILEINGWGEPLLPENFMDIVELDDRRLVIRAWISGFYNLAGGTSEVPVPWSSVIAQPTAYITQDSWPAEVEIKDPSKLRKDEVKRLYSFWREKEADDKVPAFVFHHIRGGKRRGETVPALDWRVKKGKKGQGGKEKTKEAAIKKKTKEAARKKKTKVEEESNVESEDEKDRKVKGPMTKIRLEEANMESEGENDRKVMGPKAKIGAEEASMEPEERKGRKRKGLKAGAEMEEANTEMEGSGSEILQKKMFSGPSQTVTTVINSKKEPETAQTRTQFQQSTSSKVINGDQKSKIKASDLEDVPNDVETITHPGQAEAKGPEIVGVNGTGLQQVDQMTGAPVSNIDPTIGYALDILSRYLSIQVPGGDSLFTAVQSQVPAFGVPAIDPSLDQHQSGMVSNGMHNAFPTNGPNDPTPVGYYPVPGELLGARPRTYEEEVTKDPSSAVDFDQPRIKSEPSADGDPGISVQHSVNINTGRKRKRDHRKGEERSTESKERKRKKKANTIKGQGVKSEPTTDHIPDHEPEQIGAIGAESSSPSKSDRPRRSPIKRTQKDFEAHSDYAKLGEPRDETGKKERGKTKPRVRPRPVSGRVPVEDSDASFMRVTSKTGRL